LLAFSNTVLHASKLKAENVRPLNTNNYWIPDDYLEENPWLRFLDRIKLIIKSKATLNERMQGIELGEYKLLNRSCFDTGLPDGSIDYIITDPPYGDSVQYSELSLIWNSWMKFKFDNEEEVIINPVQNKGLAEYLELFERSISESKRVLKSGKYFTLCFHNKSFEVWKGVLDIFKKHDFVLDNAIEVDTHGNSYNNNWAKFSPKTDLYLTFYKDQYSATHHSKYSPEGLLRKIISANNRSGISEIYNEFSLALINELYFNEYHIDVSTLTIKNIAMMMQKIKNGN
jgi:hypothetical protein